MSLEDRVDRLERRLDKYSERLKDVERAQNVLLWEKALVGLQNAEVVPVPDVTPEAIQRVRVGAFMDEATVMEYDYDDSTNKVTTIYYKNAGDLACTFVVYQEPGHVEIFSHPLPAHTNDTLIRNIPVAQRPNVPGADMSVSFGCR